MSNNALHLSISCLKKTVILCPPHTSFPLSPLSTIDKFQRRNTHTLRRLFGARVPQIKKKSSFLLFLRGRIRFYKKRWKSFEFTAFFSKKDGGRHLVLEPAEGGRQQKETCWRDAVATFRKFICSFLNIAGQMNPSCGRKQLAAPTAGACGFGLCSLFEVRARGIIINESFAGLCPLMDCSHAPGV